MRTRIAWGLLGLLGAGAAAWAVGRVLTPGEEAEDQALAPEAVALIPLAHETQEGARWLAYEGEKDKAVKTLRKEGALSGSDATAIVDALLADRSLPHTYDQAATALSSRRPELAERVRTLNREDRHTEASDLLREEAGVGPQVGRHIVDALGR